MPAWFERLRSNAFVRRLGIVSGMTLVSRATGFLRDIVIAAVLGNGALADAFFVALRLPNHFRSIFAEGAFNAAFVPTYSGALAKEGDAAARHVAGRILSILTLIQLVVLVAVEIWAGEFVTLVTPEYGFGTELGSLTIELTRITFPYLAFVTVATALSGVLNAHQRFAAAAGAPILFNVGIVAGLGLTFLLPSAAHGAAWGVTLSGAAQVAVLVWAASRAGILPRFEVPHLDDDLKTFLKRVAPAIIGSGSAQIAIFADTIIAAALPVGAVSALYYADRLYQLPVGVLAVALGTVLLPDLSRRYAKGDVLGAIRARVRALRFAFLVSVPFVLAFVAASDVLIRLAFGYGAFNLDAAGRAALTLSAYGVGLPAVVMLRPMVAGFHAQGDTRTPMAVGLAVIGINVAAKIALTGVIDVAGLALATSIGAWLNLVTLWLIIARRDRAMAAEAHASLGRVAADDQILP